MISRELNRLTTGEGVELLSARGIHGKRAEMEKAVEEVLGHALSLNLLGAYLDAIHGGDVNQREQLKLGEVIDPAVDPDAVGDDSARYARRAARIIEGPVARFEALADRGAETAILYMAGLFDRPAEREALDALLAPPAIPGLTDVFHGIPDGERYRRRRNAITRLRKMRLLNPEDKSDPGSLDAHPIVRAHFGKRLKEHMPDAHGQARSRLYDFYRYRGLPEAFRTPEAYGLLVIKGIFPDEPLDAAVQGILAGELTAEDAPQFPPTIFGASREKLTKAAALIGTAAFDETLANFLPGDLEGMQPYFAAIAHGCAAGRHQEAFSEVYWPHVGRGNEAFIAKKLGALNANLAALTTFFDIVWRVPAKSLRDRDKKLILNNAAFALQALGRPREAIEPCGSSMNEAIAGENWEDAAIEAINISELYLTFGNISKAVEVAGRGVAYADNSGNLERREYTHAALANALHQTGEPGKAAALFGEAEAMQAKRQPSRPKLYSLRGYQYCDLLLAQGEIQAVIDRATYAIQVARRNNWLLDIALDNLSLGRAHASLQARSAAEAGSDPAARTSLFSGWFGRPAPRPDEKVRTQDADKARQHLDAAVDGLRRSNRDDHLPRGLLARAAFRRQTGESGAAATDLDEALDIARRGEMSLHLTDWRLESARLAAGGPAALRAEAETHRAEAQKLIDATGYERRLPELAAIRACLDGKLPAARLGPDLDDKGRPSLHWLKPG